MSIRHFLTSLPPWKESGAPGRYEWLCAELKIKCVRFAIPNQPDIPSKAISVVAVRAGCRMERR